MSQNFFPVSQSDHVTFTYDNSTGWDYQALRAVFELGDWLTTPPTIVADERMCEVVAFNRPNYALVSLPNRTPVNQEILRTVQALYQNTRVFRFADVAAHLTLQFGTRLAPANKPWPAKVKYLDAPHERILFYASQLENIATAIQMTYGSQKRVAFVATCYDKPRSDMGLTEEQQFTEGRRQTLLVDDIAAICAHAQRSAFQSQRIFPVFVSFQYGDKQQEAERAARASASQSCPTPIVFLDELDLNNGFLDQIAALLAMQQFAQKHQSFCIALGNASTYQHLVGAVGYFDASIVALHNFALESAKDDREYWLTLGRSIPGCHAYQQQHEGDWAPVLQSMKDKLTQLLSYG
jgi:hypothetical protein